MGTKYTVSIYVYINWSGGGGNVRALTYIRLQPRTTGCRHPARVQRRLVVALHSHRSPRVVSRVFVCIAFVCCNFCHSATVSIRDCVRLCVCARVSVNTNLYYSRRDVRVRVCVLSLIFRTLFFSQSTHHCRHSVS